MVFTVGFAVAVCVVGAGLLGVGDAVDVPASPLPSSASGDPSPSESGSRWSRMPSPSESAVPCSASGRPSLSESVSIAFVPTHSYCYGVMALWA